MPKIQFRRGLEAARQHVVPDSGEALWTTDTHELFVGDHSTVGGIPIGTMKPVSTPAAGSVATFKDGTGRGVVPVTKDAFLTGYATHDYVAGEIQKSVTDSAVPLATKATTADNALALGGRTADDFLSKVNLTSVVTDTSLETKVVKASAIAQLNADLRALIKSGLANKFDASSLRDLNNLGDTTKPFSTAGAQDLLNRLNVVKNTANSAQSTANANKGVIDRYRTQTFAYTRTPTGSDNGVGKDGDLWVVYQ